LHWYWLRIIVANDPHPLTLMFFSASNVGTPRLTKKPSKRASSPRAFLF
jgi:hypothetical protein